MAGSGAWFGENDRRNTGFRVPGPEQSNQIGELAAILHVCESIILRMAWRPEESPIYSRTTERTLHGHPGICVPSTQLNYKQAPLENPTSGRTGEPEGEERENNKSG